MVPELVVLLMLESQFVHDLDFRLPELGVFEFIKTLSAPVPGGIAPRVDSH